MLLIIKKVILNTLLLTGLSVAIYALGQQTEAKLAHVNSEAEIWITVSQERHRKETTHAPTVVDPSSTYNYISASEFTFTVTPSLLSQDHIGEQEGHEGGNWEFLLKGNISSLTLFSSYLRCHIHNIKNSLQEWDQFLGLPSCVRTGCPFQLHLKGDAITASRVRVIVTLMSCCSHWSTFRNSKFSQDEY